MANHNPKIENLTANADKTPIERSESARNAGIASGKARAERKTFKETLLMLLQEGNIQEQINLAILQKAMKGDTKAFELIRDTIGEKPVDKQEIDIGEKSINITLTDDTPKS